MDELASLQESARQTGLEAFRSTCYQEQPPTKWHSELTTMYFRSLLIFCLLTGTPLLAQEKATGVSRNEEPMSSFQAVNVSIDALLQEYEQLTGNVLIKDSSLAANALPISISVPKPVPRSELVRIIESVLLLNNYALIPGPEPKTVKVINMNTGKNPRSEGLPLYASPAWPSQR
jgi:type II secretory pathway component GspD/PulD (secretin)